MGFVPFPDSAKVVPQLAITTPDTALPTVELVIGGNTNVALQFAVGLLVLGTVVYIVSYILTKDKNPLETNDSEA